MSQEPQEPGRTPEPGAAGGWPQPPAEPGGQPTQPGWGQPPVPPGQQPGWGQPPVPPGQQPGWGQPPAWGQGPGWSPVPAGSGGWAAARPKPGIIPLRPIALGEMFDGGFQAIRSNPRTMIGLSALVLAVVTVISAIPQAFLLRGTGDAMLGATTPDEMFGALGSTLQGSAISGFMSFVAVEIITGMLVLAVSSAVLGQKLGPGAAWARIRRRVFAVLGLALLQGLAVGAAFVVPILPGVLIAVAGQTVLGVALGLLGLLGGTVLAVFLATRWSFAAPALLLEEQRVTAAFGRSFRLVRGSFWRVFGILLLTQIVVGIGSAIIQTPFGIVSGLLQISSSKLYADVWTNLGQLLIAGVGTVIAGAIFYPFSAAVTTLLYIDVRMRREGLDVELLRAAEVGPAA